MSVRRAWAWPLVPLYATALTVKNAIRSAGFPRTRKLLWPVVSIGSVSVGGAGKTPVVIALTRLLRARGWAVDVLSRGYGREGKTTQRVPTNERDAARLYGDEPVLIARATEASVWVGTSRFDAGQAAEQGVKPVGPPVHLIDDGFQHRQLKRKLDIALVTAADLHDHLLPAGNLREPLRALARANALIVREDEREAILPRVRELVGAETPIWSTRRKLNFPAPLGVLGAGLRPLAFCAIARPEGFQLMLAKAGCGVVDTLAFPDHHAYTAADIDRLLKLAAEMNVTGFITTEKDGVKLSRELRTRLSEAGPLMVVALEVEFVNEAEVMAEFEGWLA